MALVALTLQNQGNYEAAEVMNQQALDGFERMLGPNSSAHWRASAA